MSSIITDSFLYLHPPKTGGKTVASVLKRVSPPSHVESRGHVPLRSFSRTRRLPSTLIATVRNPFDRMVSLWFIRAKHRGMNFSQFVESIISGRDRWYAAKPQSYWLILKGSMPKMLLIRHERFEEDLRSTLGKLNLVTPAVIPRKNRTIGRAPGYRRYYSRCNVQAVSELYSSDLKLLGYRF